MHSIWQGDKRISVICMKAMGQKWANLSSAIIIIHYTWKRRHIIIRPISSRQISRKCNAKFSPQFLFMKNEDDVNKMHAKIVIYFVLKSRPKWTIKNQLGTQDNIFLLQPVVTVMCRLCVLFGVVFQFQFIAFSNLSSHIISTLL